MSVDGSIAILKGVLVNDFCLRKHQQETVDAVVGGGKGARVVAWLPPGSGKTIGGLAAANALHQAGQIDCAIALTPRRNLCVQYELDWQEFRPHFGDGAMGAVVHRRNDSLRLLSGQSGYVTTYQSLLSNPDVHMRFARAHRGRFLLVCDEAQFLGVDGAGPAPATKSARAIEAMGDLAHGVLVMTGTPYRADGNPIVYAKYDDDGRIQPDVMLTYGEGYAQGFLRPYVAHLLDGDVEIDVTRFKKRTFTPRDRRMTGSANMDEIEEQLSHLARQPEVWKPIVNRTVAFVREARRVYPYSGVIAAHDQQHAREISRYLESAGVLHLVAISDNVDAHGSLMLFKNGEYDILITVGMAHIGYDHKPILAVGVCTGIRWGGWLDQLIMRAGRVMADRPEAEQVAHIFAPNDVLMRDFLAQKQDELSQALRLLPPEDPRKRAHFQRNTESPFLGANLDKVVEIDSRTPARRTDVQQRRILRRRLAQAVNSLLPGEQERIAVRVRLARMMGGGVTGWTTEQLSGAIEMVQKGELCDVLTESN